MKTHPGCWNIGQVADHMGVTANAARGNLSRAKIRGEHHYPADQVEIWHTGRPGRGRHSDGAIVSDTLSGIHPYARPNIAEGAALRVSHPSRVWWEAAPSAIHRGDGGVVWAAVTAYVEWPNGASASALLEVSSIGVEPRDLGQSTAVDFAVADAVAAVLTEDAAYEIERSANLANDSRQACDLDSAPCVCGHLYPEVRHPGRGDCDECAAAWKALATHGGWEGVTS